MIAPHPAPHRLLRHTLFLVAFASLCVIYPATAADAQADTLRVLPEGQLPNDARLAKAKDLNGYFPFEVPATKEAWGARAAELRRRILVATGLWPLPERTPLKPVIHGRVQRDGFTVDKVYFESMPNHFVTGLLFRPSESNGKLPVVLCPHGHGGRLQDHGAQRIGKLIEEGQERFEDCGRYPKLSRCAQLARMGCIVFIYDMLGYVDSGQLSRGLTHGFSKQRPEFDTKESWGLFSTQAEMRMQSVMGIQTWNSIRGLDFLCSLPDADPARVGVTGGSGGGTQTILLCAIDPRPVVAFPQGMVSTSMQGGCTCENCCLLRVGTGNVELTALFAPKPQGMTAANDWTKEMMTKGYPQLQQLYAMLGAKDNVFCESQTHFPHNYNYVTRALMYGLFNKHLELGFDEPIVEEHWQPLTSAEWTVWNDEHPKPGGGDVYERSLCRWLDETSDVQMLNLTPRNADSLSEYREIVGGAFDTIIGKSLADIGQVEEDDFAYQPRDTYVFAKGLLRVSESGAELPIIKLFPEDSKTNGDTVIWLSGQGKRGMFADDGQPRAAVRGLLAAGKTVVGVDLLYQGEFLSGEGPLSETPVVANKRQSAAYTFCYNHTVFARRVHDILSVVALIRKTEPKAEIHLVAVEGAGPLAAAARAQAGSAVAKAAIDAGGFRFVDLKSYRDPGFLPGVVKYGDLPALLALSAPHATWIAGEGGDTPELAVAAYKAAGQPAAVESFSGQADDVPQAVVKWLLAR